MRADKNGNRLSNVSAKLGTVVTVCTTCYNHFRLSGYCMYYMF